MELDWTEMSRLVEDPVFVIDSGLLDKLDSVVDVASVGDEADVTRLTEVEEIVVSEEVE